LVRDELCRLFGLDRARVRVCTARVGGGFGSKQELLILANVAHQELASSGIRTVALAPGLTDTPGMRDSIGEDYIERISQTYPGRRLGQPQDIVPLTAFLCSSAASELSGTVISVRPPATG
jgi:NAD(P)-dependent dehydrogenase (short-subunit alcohol dehydrogenase family)